MSEKDLEEVVKDTTEAIILTPVKITTGVVKGTGSAINKLLDWI